MHSDEGLAWLLDAGYVYRVLMPCRALDAFGRTQAQACARLRFSVLMPCRALDAFGPKRRLMEV